MLTGNVPETLRLLLAAFAPCFTVRTFATFQALVVGFLAQPGVRTVTGMLTAAGLAGRRHHDLAYRFFATARWSADEVGLVVAGLAVTLLPADAPLLVVVDDTLLRRTGRKLHGAAWHHDGSGPGRHRPAWGHRWVVLGILVEVPFVAHRPLCLPVLCRLWRPGDPDQTPSVLARRLLETLAERFSDRTVHLVGDAAYATSAWRDAPSRVTVTARLRCDAALHQLPGARTGRPGRPKTKGDRLPELTMIAAMTCHTWAPARVRCYGITRDREILVIRCLWYRVFAGQPVQVVLARTPGAPDGYELALVSTDLHASGAELIQRYAARWEIEQAFLDGKHQFGIADARIRTQRSVERVVPLALAATSLAIIWYTRHGQPTADLAAHRARAPWYTTKQAISVADMHAALRRALLTARFRLPHHDQATCDLFPDALLSHLNPAA
jgi:DDE superfamily endonuclease